MLIHYIKITIRNILANKFNYLLTTLGLAVGISIFAVIYFMVDALGHHNVDLPNEQNLYEIKTISEEDGNIVSDYRDAPYLAIEKLEKQTFPEFETFGFCSYKIELYCNEESNEKVIFETSLRYANSDLFSVIGATFLYGNTDSWENNDHLAVITESLAKKLFGKNNAIGRKIEIRDTRDYLYGVYTISGVIKPIYTQKYQADIFLKISNKQRTDIAYTIIKLKNGTSVQSFNQQLKTVSSDFNIQYPWRNDNKEKVFFLQISDIQDSKSEIPFYIYSLVLLLASIVLIVALFNFFNLLIGSVHVRIRQFSLRKIVGANRWTFFLMFFCEIIPILAGALLGSYIFIELLIKWLESSQFMPSELMDKNGIISLVYFYPLKITGWTLLVCSVLAFLLAQRIQRIVLLQGIRGKLLKSHRNYLRNALVSIQLIFTLVFLSISLGIIRFASSEMSGFYQTLSRKQAKSVFQIPVDILKINSKKDEIVNRIKQIHGVENAIIGDGFGLSNTMIRVTLSNGINDIMSQNIYFEGYNQFFELKEPIPQSSLAPDEVIINEKLANLLREYGDTELNTTHGKYKIVGTIKYIPYSEIKDYAALFSPNTGFGHSVCIIKSHPEQSKYVKEEILKIIREYIPETIPYRISTLYEEMNNQYLPFFGIIGAMWFASIMSLIITLLGIYTAVTTDTQRRKKEIAIRKINGATYRDIILQFTKLYAIMLIIALVVSIPLNCAILTMMQIPINSLKDGLINTFPTWCVIVVFVYLTIFRLIRQAARKNPAEVIKSE